MSIDLDLVKLDMDDAEGGGRIATLHLHDPDRRNALTVPMGEAFEARVAELQATEDLRAMVLTGSPPAFSAGGDLAFLLARADDQPDRNASEMRAFYRRFLLMRELEVPILAAVNGHAIGAGLCLALACDLRIVAQRAKLGATFVGLGLHPGMGATAFLRSVAGPEVASWLLLTGAVITGEQAASRGMALEALREDEVLPRARALAEQMAAAGPVAVRQTVRSLRMQQDDLLERALRREADAQAACYATDDLREGVAAVKEKRRGRFVGR